MFVISFNNLAYILWKLGSSWLRAFTRLSFKKTPLCGTAINQLQHCTRFFLTEKPEMEKKSHSKKVMISVVHQLVITINFYLFLLVLFSLLKRHIFVEIYCCQNASDDCWFGWFEKKEGNFISKRL